MRELRFTAERTSSSCFPPHDFASRKSLSEALTIHGELSRGFLTGATCVIPVACLITLLVGMVAAFRSCPYLPRRAHRHSDNRQAPGRPDSHAETEPARGLTEPLIRHHGRGREIEVRHRRTICACAACLWHDNRVGHNIRRSIAGDTLFDKQT